VVSCDISADSGKTENENEFRAERRNKLSKIVMYLEKDLTTAAS
jgi:hypothetical protein